MIRTLADQYLAQNAGRRYPLADDSGYDGIPDDTALLDFRCTVRGVPAGVAPTAWITNVAGGGEENKTITVTVDRPGAPDVLDFVIPRTMAEGSPFVATAHDESTGAEGVLTVSAAAHAIANGIEAIPLARTTVVCDSLKVDSVQSAQGAAAGDEGDPPGRDAAAEISGEIVLAEGRNVEPYLDGNRLRLDIFKGGGLGELCQTVSPAAGGQRCDTVLFTVNGERPGSTGDLMIVGDDGITVTPDPANHALEIRMDEAAADRMADGCAPVCASAR